jgi:hypothetical protein
MKINKKKIVMPGMRRKVTFIKLNIFRNERRREEERCNTRGYTEGYYILVINFIHI